MRIPFAALPLAVAALVGCAGKPAPAPAPTPVAQAPAPLAAGTLDEQTVSAAATVQKIDLKTRHVTLQRADGTKFTIVAGPDVRNLDKVRRGDVVRLTYRQSIAYEVKKAGEAAPGVSAGTSVTRAQPGAKPGGSVTDTVNVRMTITAIDKGAHEATLLAPDGTTTVVKVRDPSKLDVVKPGDVVDLTYTEALAIAVEKAK
jgi:Cu/Ag efflux protein CusF